MSTESLRTYNKIEPSSFYIKYRIIQIIWFSALLLWIIVYTTQAINFNEYEDGSLINIGSLIKSILFLATLFFTMSIFLGTLTYYKIKRTYSNDASDRITNVIFWFTLGLMALILSIPLISFPGSDRFFAIYLIALLYAGNHVKEELLKKIET